MKDSNEEDSIDFMTNYKDMTYIAYATCGNCKSSFSSGEWGKDLIKALDSASKALREHKAKWHPSSV